MEFNKDYTIIDFCKDVLIKRFPNDRAKQKINESSVKLNFACPFCGDSERSSHKKRGNLHLDTNTYKCFNDGCMIWMELPKFVSTLAEKYELNIPTIQDSKVEFTLNTTHKSFLVEFLINQESHSNLLSFIEIVNRFSLFPCSSADENSKIGKYVRSRELIGLPLFEKTCYYDSRQDKIYLFNLDMKSDKIIGFSTRDINPSATGLRYKIKGYKELKENGLVTKLSDEYIQKVDIINSYFNILNLDFTKDITLTEGQIDAMFIYNCAATTGVTKSKLLLNSLPLTENIRILFDNDKAGIEQSIQYLKLGYRVFLWSKLVVDLKRKFNKDTYEIKNKLKDINDLYKFLKIRDSSLNYDKFNTIINDYFSNSPYDLLLL